MAVNNRKVAIVGCGRSGSAVSFALMQSGLFSEMVLIDSLAGRADRVALDLAYGISFTKSMNIYAGGYDDLADAGIVILAAGEPRLKTDSRMEFIRKNVNVFESIIPEVAKRNTEAIFLVVTNPNDILTYSTLKYIEIPESRIMGIGTILDTARVPLREFFEMRGYQDPDDFLKEIIKDVRKDAGELSGRKDSTFYGVAMATRRVCEAIVRDEKAVLSVSSLMYGAFDIDGIALSMPAVVGADGVECLVPVAMNEDELDEIRKSAATVRSIADDVLGEAR